MEGQGRALWTCRHGSADVGQRGRPRHQQRRVYHARPSQSAGWSLGTGPLSFPVCAPALRPPPYALPTRPQRMSQLTVAMLAAVPMPLPQGGAPRSLTAARPAAGAAPP